MRAPKHLTAALGVLAAWTTATDAQTLELLSTGDSTAVARLEQVEADVRAAFAAALDRYDAEIATRPFDVLARLEQCRFIDEFAATYEYVSWSDEIYSRGEQCANDLEIGFAEHPETAIWRLEGTFGEQRAAEARRLLERSDINLWTPGQLSRVHAALAESLSSLGAEDLPQAEIVEHAQRALDLDERADVRLMLATGQIATGDRAAALATLTPPFDGHDTSDNYYRARKMALLAELGARAAVRKLAEELEDHDGYYDRVEAAAALRKVGEIDLARRALDDAANQTYTSVDERQRFLLELEHGSAATAMTAYEALRDLGWQEDPLGADRVALFVRHPSLPFATRDLLALAGLALAVVSIGMGALLPIVVVHYRGLARRASSGVAVASPAGVRLRHAWAALMILSLAEVAAVYISGPIDITPSTNLLQTLGDAALNARWVLAASLLTPLFALPLANAVQRYYPQWWGAEWSIGRSFVLGAVAAYALRVPLVLSVAVAPELTQTLMLEDELWQMLDRVRAEYGSAAMLWTVALAAPVVEEFLFRGVLLRAFNRHLSFAAANAFQAFLFAAAHMDLSAMPLLFAFGALAGFLTRKSGGLLAPIVMHAFFNLIAAIVLLD